MNYLKAAEEMPGMDTSLPDASLHSFADTRHIREDTTDADSFAPSVEGPSFSRMSNHSDSEDDADADVDIDVDYGDVDDDDHDQSSSTSSSNSSSSSDDSVESSTSALLADALGSETEITESQRNEDEHSDVLGKSFAEAPGKGAWTTVECDDELGLSFADPARARKALASAVNSWNTTVMASAAIDVANSDIFGQSNLENVVDSVENGRDDAVDDIVGVLNPVSAACEPHVNVLNEEDDDFPLEENGNVLESVNIVSQSQEETSYASDESMSINDDQESSDESIEGDPSSTELDGLEEPSDNPRHQDSIVEVKHNQRQQNSTYDNHLTVPQQNIPHQQVLQYAGIPAPSTNVDIQTTIVHNVHMQPYHYPQYTVHQQMQSMPSTSRSNSSSNRRASLSGATNPSMELYARYSMSSSAVEYVNPDDGDIYESDVEGEGRSSSVTRKTKSSRPRGGSVGNTSLLHSSMDSNNQTNEDGYGSDDDRVRSALTSGQKKVAKGRANRRASYSGAPNGSFNNTHIPVVYNAYGPMGPAAMIIAGPVGPNSSMNQYQAYQQQFLQNPSFQQEQIMLRPNSLPPGSHFVPLSQEQQLQYQQLQQQLHLHNTQAYLGQSHLASQPMRHRGILKASKDQPSAVDEIHVKSTATNSKEAEESHDVVYPGDPVESSYPTNMGVPADRGVAMHVQDGEESDDDKKQKAPIVLVSQQPSSPRRGRKPNIGQSAPTSETLEAPKSHNGPRTRRGVVRQLTGDSMEMSLMAASVGSGLDSAPNNPRRAGKRQTNDFQSSPTDIDAPSISGNKETSSTETRSVGGANAPSDVNASAESPKGLRTRRGVVRQATGDSIEMSLMAASAISAVSIVSPDQPRRGGRRRKNDSDKEKDFIGAPPITYDETSTTEEMDSGDNIELNNSSGNGNNPDLVVSGEVDMDTSENVGLKPSDGCASAGLDASSETHKGLRTRRGVVRQATGDSMEMSLMAASAQAASTVSSNQPRRAGRRRKNDLDNDNADVDPQLIMSDEIGTTDMDTSENVELKPSSGSASAGLDASSETHKGLRTRRGVVRQATGDSMEMSLMAASAQAASTVSSNQPRRAGRRRKNDVDNDTDEVDPQPIMSDEIETTDMDTSENVELKPSSGSASAGLDASSETHKGLRTRRGVVRQATGDSIEMSLMAASAQAASNVSSNQPRRAGRRHKNDLNNDAAGVDPQPIMSDEIGTTDMDTSENVELKPSSGSASAGLDASSETHKGLRTRRGVVRQATGDSIEMSLMAASAQAASTVSSNQPRRAGRRRKNDLDNDAAEADPRPTMLDEIGTTEGMENDENMESQPIDNSASKGMDASSESHKGLRTRRGVVRQATGDSMEMSLMAASVITADVTSGKQRRGGRRQSTSFVPTGTDNNAHLLASEEALSTEEQNVSGETEVSEGNADSSESHKGLRTRRGVIRQATGDSIEMSLMAASASAASQAPANRPRRGGRRQGANTDDDRMDADTPSSTSIDVIANQDDDIVTTTTARSSTDATSDSPKGLRTRRGVVRQATGDSIEMSLMAASAQAASTVSPDQPRRGGRRRKNDPGVKVDNISAPPMTRDEARATEEMDSGDYIETQTMNNSAGKGMDGSSESHKGLRTRRGVVRQATGDSMEMSLMAASAAAAQAPPSRGRRGGRRQSNSAATGNVDDNADLVVSGDVDMDTSENVGLKPSDGSASAGLDASSETHKGLRTRRGIVRQATGDSMEMSLMAASAAAAAQTSSNKPRRGGRRQSAENNVNADESHVSSESSLIVGNEQGNQQNIDVLDMNAANGNDTPSEWRKRMRTRRGVVRQATGDSIEMSLMAASVGAHSLKDDKSANEATKARRGGRRGTGTPKDDDVDAPEVTKETFVLASNEETSRSMGLAEDSRGENVEMNSLNNVGNVTNSQSLAFSSMQPMLSSQQDENDYEYGPIQTLNQFGYFPGAYIVANPQGYGAAYIQQIPMQHVIPPMHFQGAQRRFSNASNNSRASSRSRRRHSLVLPKEAPPLLAHPRAKVDSDSDSSNSDDHPSKVMGIMVPRQMYTLKKESNEADPQSDAESNYSMSSSRRATRRNSCLENGVSDPFYASGHTIASVARFSTRASDSEKDDDPDSLFNRAKTGAATKHAAKSNKYPGKIGMESKREDQKVASLHLESETNMTTISKTEIKKQELWRSEPMTTSYQAPTIDNLKENSLFKTEGTMDIPVNSIRGNWGDMQFMVHSKDAGALSSSPSTYGEEMYSETIVAPEIDKYRQRARRRFSLENTCIDMESLAALAAESNTGSKIPVFKPAEGCRNASDYIIRCFSARLRTTGFTVLKHNRSRWSKSQYRIFYLLPDGKTLTWKVAEGEKDKGRGKAKRPEVDLSKCKEVRHAWTKDPDTKKKTGTAVLRARCKEDDAARSFSLIFSKRTLDVTAYSMDQCKTMMEGFSALCYRLQLDQMKEKKEEDEDEDSQNAVLRETASDDDWASTIYGVDSVVPSLNSGGQQNQPLTMVPWGF